MKLLESTLVSVTSQLPSSDARRSDSASVLIRASGVKKTFRMGDSEVQVLRSVDLSVREGEFVAIEGRSGSGKSTLLHIMGALDAPDGGSVVFEGRDIWKLAGGERASLRNAQVGFVFQFYHLLPELNVLENTLLAAMVKHTWFGFRSNKSQLRDRARSVLDSLGMGHRLKHRPSQLSGGERQRVAIARALMNEPKILLADEPTGNLDAETGRQIMDVLEKLHRDRRQTIIMVTHDRSLAREADRVMVLKDGKIADARQAE